MYHHAMLAIIGVLAGIGTAVAQPAQTETSPPPSTPAPAAPASSPVTMEQPLPGDHWTYDIQDEILGTVRATRTTVITEVTATEISVRFSSLGNSNSSGGAFDRSWNLISDSVWRYTPHDGMGIRLPLAVGKTWSFKSNDVNSNNGMSWSRSGTSKVVGQESTTTKAGTFDTFKIEASYTRHDVSNPTRSAQVTLQTWYAPSIDHWVKRTFTSRVAGRLFENNTQILVEYGRKP